MTFFGPGWAEFHGGKVPGKSVGVTTTVRCNYPQLGRVFYRKKYQGKKWPSFGDSIFFQAHQKTRSWNNPMILLMAEILFPTTWDGAETLSIMGKTTNLNW